VKLLVIARHCSGGVILGFEQFHSLGGTWKRGSQRPRVETGDVVFPTSWNHLEAGILFSLQVPLLVFKEDGISGGVFDSDVTDVFIHPMPKLPMSANLRKSLSEVFLKWQAKVREHYYR
jgi:hypothetical protein